MKRILTIAALLLSAAYALAAPMKARVIQPLFAQDRPGLDKSFEWTIKALDKCKPGLDIIVLPEFSEVPGATPDPADFLKIAREYGPVLLKACSETARRWCSWAASIPAARCRATPPSCTTARAI